MPDIIRNNAYRILGLDGSACQRDIMKRYREITNRLKIDDCPRYALDLNLPGNFRTEGSVDGALKKLQNHRSSLTEYFFWFSVYDSVDEEVLSLLQYGDAASYEQASQIWKEHSKTENSTGLSYKRNLAILYCLMLFDEENDSMLKESVSAWKNIVDSDVFWTSFVKNYELANDREVHAGAIAELKKNAAANISDIYHDLHEHHGNVKYVKAFHDLFETFGPKTERCLLKPICQSIYEDIEKLKRVTDEKDGGRVDGGRKNAMVEVIEQLDLYIYQLRNMGLYNSDQVMVMRDHTAEAIGNASTVLYNEMDMRKKSAELFNLAKNMSATAGMKERLGQYAKKVAESITRDEENALVIETGFIRKKYFIVRETFIEYGTSKIYYKKADTIRYYGTGSNYRFEMTSISDRVSIKIDNRPLFNELVNRVWSLAVPHLIDHLVKRIFEKNESIRIGGVRFDHEGYHRSRALRDDESVLWHGTIYTPNVADNKIILYKSKNNEPKLFTTISLQEPNSITTPALVDACHREFYIRNQR